MIDISPYPLTRIRLAQQTPNAQCWACYTDMRYDTVVRVKYV